MATYQQRIERDGFCVIEQVISEAAVGEICAELAAAVERNRRHSEAKLAEIRRRGHQIGTPGVAQLKQAINQVQSFAPYLADRRLLAVIESFFGAWARISCTDIVPLEREVFDRLPADVKPLYRHWVAQSARPDEVRGH